MAAEAERFDAVVIGAGAGGMCALSRLTEAGFKPLLLESLDRLGGRAATEEIDGFKVNIGAIALEQGGVFEETFTQAGIPLDIRVPEPPSAFYLDGKVVDVSRGGWGMLLGGLTKQAARILDTFAEARTGNLPDGRQSTEDWLSGFTKNDTVHALFRNLCAAIFACNADELPARSFLTYFTRKGAFKRFGFCPRGTGGLWEDLARAARAKGAAIRLSTPVERIEVAEGRVRGLVARRNGQKIRIESPIVISDVGPKHTLALAGEDHFPAAYREQVKTRLKPAANIVINFASPELFLTAPGLVTFGKTRRLCNMANLTATCPELAPEGWNLYVAYAVPKLALGNFDADREIEEGLADLREQFPGFAKAKILSVRVMRDDWPAQRSCAGYDMARETGIEGLWCVGDAVKADSNGGTQACAETAKLVVEHIVAARGRKTG